MFKFLTYAVSLLKLANPHFPLKNHHTNDLLNLQSPKSFQPALQSSDLIFSL